MPSMTCPMISIGDALAASAPPGLLISPRAFSLSAAAFKMLLSLPSSWINMAEVDGAPAGNSDFIPLFPLFEQLPPTLWVMVLLVAIAHDLATQLSPSSGIANEDPPSWPLSTLLHSLPCLLPPLDLLLLSVLAKEFLLQLIFVSAQIPPLPMVLPTCWQTVLLWSAAGLISDIAGRLALNCKGHCNLSSGLIPVGS